MLHRRFSRYGETFRIESVEALLSVCTEMRVGVLVFSSTGEVTAGDEVRPCLDCAVLKPGVLVLVIANETAMHDAAHTAFDNRDLPSIKG